MDIGFELLRFKDVFFDMFSNDVFAIFGGATPYVIICLAVYGLYRMVKSIFF